jgi:UDP-N-acetylmuramoyl-L-alanyl-D-glutamate--2,6-diaminopimelate ligase
MIRNPQPCALNSPVIMQLFALLDALPNVIAVNGDLGVEIAGITSDSRRVSPSELFVAYRGVDADGHQYIGDAISRRAAAVVGERALTGLDVPFVQVTDGREALAWLNAAWYGHPSRAMRVAGITGTDGKTTTANLLFGILRAAQRRVGLISTVNAVIGDSVYDTGLHTTTPDAPDTHRYLAMMRDAGTQDAVLEVTSHGLAQHRVAGCAFDVAVVTNITHEHLDFHGSYEAYREAKAILFRSLMNSPRKPDLPKTAVLNRDDASFGFLAGIPVERTVTYGIAAGPSAAVQSVVPEATAVRMDRERQLTLTATRIRHTPTGTEFDVELATGEPASARAGWPLLTPLIGSFNVHNVLAASGAALVLGVDAAAIQAGVRAVTAIPGRMERVDRGQAFTALVDFAHTPNGLARALEAARDLVAPSGRVIAVFGCAGLRDREKRRLMGEAAARLADVTIVTAEDPRTESLDAIMAETADALIAAGRLEGCDFLRVADRLRAIQCAVRQARPGDVVMVCGKGHEQSMCFGSTEYPWHDREALAWALDVERGPRLPIPFKLPTWSASE